MKDEVSVSKSIYRYCPGTCTSCACQSPTMLWVVTARANTTEKVRSGRYDGFDLRKLTVPSNPILSQGDCWRGGPPHYHSPHGCCVERITSIRTDSLDKRMRHASRPGRWLSHNETDRGGAMAPRKGSKSLVRFVRAAIARAMTWSVILYCQLWVRWDAVS